MINAREIPPMAQSYGIPIRNLGDPNTLRNVLKYLG